MCFGLRRRRRSLFVAAQYRDELGGRGQTYSAQSKGSWEAIVTNGFFGLIISCSL